MGEYKRLALRIIIGACLIVGAFAGHAAQAETKEVVAAVARDFYPEYVVDADGRPAGLGIDLMNATAKRAGLSVTYRVFEAWSDLVVALERGDADVVPVLSITPAREGRMLFTRPLVMSPGLCSSDKIPPTFAAGAISPAAEWPSSKAASQRKSSANASRAHVSYRTRV